MDEGRNNTVRKWELIVRRAMDIPDIVSAENAREAAAWRLIRGTHAVAAGSTNEAFLMAARPHTREMLDAALALASTGGLDRALAPVDGSTEEVEDAVEWAVRAICSKLDDFDDPTKAVARTFWLLVEAYVREHPLLDVF